MKAEIINKGEANWEMLKAIAKTGEAESPALKRRGEKFRAALAARQERNLARIMARPGSMAYRDYIETPARFGVAIPSAAKTPQNKATKRERARA